MEEYLWWRDGVIYQIYPRSFLDTNADGIGDLTGITSRLDYLADLGVTALWLSPIYPSPDADFGYDVADHTAIDPRYGTSSDFDILVEEAHRRGLRVILDAVLNHTSDQHPWFIESRSSRDNPKRDWYTWRPPARRAGLRRPPNNWVSSFGGSAWQFDALTGEYYYHLFLRQQPDLNFNNPAVRQAQLDVLRFWLDRGVDGFRLDVFNAYFEDPALADNPGWLAPLTGLPIQKHLHDSDQPGLLPFLGELRALLDGYPNRYAVGETFGDKSIAARYASAGLLHAAFSFDFTPHGIFSRLNPFRRPLPFNPRDITERVMRRESLFKEGVWPTTVFSNHDIPRAATRYGRGEEDGPARLALALLLTLRGTPFMYQGEEIGMRDISLGRREILDPPGRRYWPLYRGRDGCRAPLQWNSGPQAGFSAGQPWLPVHPDYLERNVAAQKADQGSLFHFTRRLIALRQMYPALQRGEFIPLAATERVLAYQRKGESETLTILLNFVKGPSDFSLPGKSSVLLSTGRTEKSVSGSLQLEPFEVCIVKAE